MRHAFEWIMLDQFSNLIRISHNRRTPKSHSLLNTIFDSRL